MYCLRSNETGHLFKIHVQHGYAKEFIATMYVYIGIEITKKEAYKAKINTIVREFFVGKILRWLNFCAPLFLAL